MTDRGGEPSGWEAAYRARPSFGYMTDDHHEDCEALQRIFHHSGVRRILDLGCGDGRHLVYFAQFGYHMYGQDIAPTAVELARSWLVRESLSADLAAGDMTSILWPESTFDAMLCVQVINHHRIRKIRRTIEEIRRSLRNGGFLFLTISINPPLRPDAPRAIEVEPHTWVPTEGHEKGVPHHEFTMAELLHEFRRFSIREDLMPIHKDTNEYTCVLFQKAGGRPSCHASDADSSCWEAPTSKRRS